ncbi:MAG: hypothetical protein H6558_11120 [Lewinellaceae bacterium]|nr:hypothetical protein [Lewinellaceae bacterium]
MKIKRCIFFSITFFALGITGCYYDVEEELYPAVECDTQGVSYSGTVQPLLSGNCYVCHSAAVNTAGITLEGYNNLKVYVDNGRFLGAIQHQPGFSPMPQGAAQLPECDILKIEQWITDGAPNN